MAVTNDTLESRLNSLNKVTDTTQLETAADKAQQSFSDAKSTTIGSDAEKTIGGLRSVTNQSLDVNATNIEPTEVLLNNFSRNDAVNTDISNLSSDILVQETITYSSIGADSVNVSITRTPQQTTGSVKSVLASITGLGVEPGYLQSIITSGNPQSLVSDIPKLGDQVGAFNSREDLIDFGTGPSSRTQTVMADVIANTVHNNDSASPEFNLFEIEKTNVLNDLDAVVERTTRVGERQLQNIIRDIANVRSREDAEDIIRNSRNVGKDIVNVAKESLSLDRIVNNFVGFSSTGFAQGLVNSQDQSNADSIFRNLKGLSISPQQRDEVIRKAQGTQQEKAEAYKILEENSNANAAEIRNALQNLDTTLAGTLVVDTTGSVFEDPFNIGTSGQKWNNGVGSEDYTFSFVSSVEELEAEIKNITREVTEVIVHCSDTYTNTNIGSEELNKISNSLGENGIPYHYVIRRDGSLQRGRPVNNEGTHTISHNEYTIAVCFVGGINAPSGTPNAVGYRSSEALTRSQMRTFYEFCKAFYMYYPGGQILGHSDVEVDQYDPGFDVIEYVLSTFGKKTVYTDPTSEGPFSPSELISRNVT